MIPGQKVKALRSFPHGERMVARGDTVDDASEGQVRTWLQKGWVEPAGKPKAADKA